MRVVKNTLDGLERDLKALPAKSAREFAKRTRKVGVEGNRIASRLAKQSAGAHGKHYHRAFSVEMRGPFSVEYGPDASKPQGNMSFENGSRNQKPHRDLARSADIAGFRFASEIADALEDLFW